MDNKNSVFRSLDIIEGRILEKLTVENIANSVHFSKYHYQRMFREIVGESVMSYVTKRKLTLAGRELLETNATVLEVALMFGFDSHEGFTRSFKAYMGVTPTDYRKHHLSAISLKNVKGKCAMLYSKTTDGIIRELNDLIVHAKEAAEYTRKNKGVIETPQSYSDFWDYIADKTDGMAEELKGYLDRITVIAQHPDEISARFIIIKAIEDISFKSNITALNVGLAISRAVPEHGAVYKPIVEKYYALAGFAQGKAKKIVGFFNELVSLIFEDMRKGATQRLKAAIEKGNTAAAVLTSNPDYPYGYIANEITEMVNRLSAMPISKVTVACLEDCLFQLYIISFAADTDMFRAPNHKSLFDGIAHFRKSLNDALEFFQSLSTDVIQSAELDYAPVIERTLDKNYSDIAFQGNILLFVIRGEVQKMGKHILQEEQKIAFDSICGKLNKAITLAIQLAHNEIEKTASVDVASLIRAVHNELIAEADRLGLHGNAIRFIAEEVKHYAARAESLAK